MFTLKLLIQPYQSRVLDIMDMLLIMDLNFPILLFTCSVGQEETDRQQHDEEHEQPPTRSVYLARVVIEKSEPLNEIINDK